jgi:drug/metabolite transporter (DMT)-like permease
MKKPASDVILSNDRKALMFALGAMLCWSTVAVAFKMALKHLAAPQLLLISNYVALLALVIQSLLQGKTGLFFRQRLNHWLSSMVLGFLNPFFYYLILFKAYSLLPAQVAQPINFIWPIMLMLLSVPLLRQKLSMKSLFALLISFIGVFALSMQGHITGFAIEEPAGVLLALSSSVIWALYWILNMKDSRDDQVKLLTNFLFSSVYITLWCLFSGEISSISRAGILPAVYSGLFEMGIAFVLWLKALQFASSTAKVSNLIYITPFVSLIFIHFILKEEIFLTSLAGLLLIVSGIILQQYDSKPRKQHKS